MGALTNWMYYPNIHPSMTFRDFGYFRTMINEGLRVCPHCGGKAEMVKVGQAELAALKKVRVAIRCMHGFKPKCNQMVPSKVLKNHEFTLAGVSKLIALWNHPIIGFLPFV